MHPRPIQEVGRKPQDPQVSPSERFTVYAGRPWHTAFHKKRPDLVPHPLPDEGQLQEMIHNLPLQMQSFTDEPEFYCAVLAIPPDLSFQGAPLHLQVRHDASVLPNTLSNSMELCSRYLRVHGVHGLPTISSMDGLRPELDGGEALRPRSCEGLYFSTLWHCFLHEHTAVTWQGEC